MIQYNTFVEYNVEITCVIWHETNINSTTYICLIEICYLDYFLICFYSPSEMEYVSKHVIITHVAGLEVIQMVNKKERKNETTIPIRLVTRTSLAKCRK